MRQSEELASEATVAGESCERILSGGQECTQLLVPGVAPVSLRDRLALRAAAPLEPKKLQRPADFGLFDMAARNQLDLFSKLPPKADEGSHQSSTLMGS